MSFREFGTLVDESPKEGQKFKEFGTLIDAAPKQKPEFKEFGTPYEEPSRLRSLASAFPKGVVKAARNLSPLPNLGPIPDKLAEKLTEQFLPTQEKAPEEILERAGKLATYTAGGGGSLLGKGIRAGAGTLLGQATKELGGGETAQNIAELVSLGFPGLSKDMPIKKAQEKVVSFLKEKGFTPNEITPLLQSPKKLSRLAKFASKGEKTNQLMRDTYQKFDNVYGSIREEGSKLPGLSGEKYDKFVSDFDAKLDKIPKFYRRLMKEEIEDLRNSPHAFSDLMDFKQAVNARVGGVSGGKAWLGTLKEPIRKGLDLIDPKLASDYKLADQLYSKTADVSKHLRTKEIEDLVSMGEAWTTVAGVADQNMGTLRKVMTAVAARALAREMLINPKLQNISMRMNKAIKHNAFPIAKKLYEEFKQELPEDIRQQMPED